MSINSKAFANDPGQKTVEIIRQTRINGKAAEIGEIVTISATEANFLIAIKKAKLAPKPKPKPRKQAD